MIILAFCFCRCGALGLAPSARPLETTEPSRLSVGRIHGPRIHVTLAIPRGEIVLAAHCRYPLESLNAVK